jgi:hypothetical protein
MIKKVCFFGASITSQRQDSYVDEFAKEFDGFCEKMGYGSSHFNDAGFYLFHEAIAHSPDLLIFDWNSTSSSQFDLFKLEYVVSRANNLGITPLFVIFPRPDNWKVNRLCEEQVYSLAKRQLVEVCDIRKFLSLDEIMLCTRDRIHANSFGAKVYANYLLEFVSKLNLKKSNDAERIYVDDQFIKTLTFSEIISQGVDELPFKYKINGGFSEIAMAHSVGPWSPVIDLIESNKRLFSISLWDPWCHYARNKFEIIFPNFLISKMQNSQGDFYFKKSDTSPNYGLCRNKQFQFDCELQIRPIKFYYTGFEIQLSF